MVNNFKRIAFTAFILGGTSASAIAGQYSTSDIKEIAPNHFDRISRLTAESRSLEIEKQQPHTYRGSGDYGQITRRVKSNPLILQMLKSRAQTMRSAQKPLPDSIFINPTATSNNFLPKNWTPKPFDDSVASGTLASFASFVSFAAVDSEGSLPRAMKQLAEKLGDKKKSIKRGLSRLEKTESMKKRAREEALKEIINPDENFMLDFFNNQAPAPKYEPSEPEKIHLYQLLDEQSQKIAQIKKLLAEEAESTANNLMDFFGKKETRETTAQKNIPSSFQENMQELDDLMTDLAFLLVSDSQKIDVDDNDSPPFLSNPATEAGRHVNIAVFVANQTLKFIKNTTKQAKESYKSFKSSFKFIF